VADAPTRVAPELTRYLDDYISEVALGEVLDEELEPGSNLLAFCRGAFDQLLANVVGVEAKRPSANSAVQMRTLMRKRKRQWSPELSRLMGRFQHFCKIYPDVTGDEYGGGSEAMTSFHTDFVPGFIRDLEAWAASEQEKELASALAHSRGDYDAWVQQFYDDLALGEGEDD